MTKKMLVLLLAAAVSFSAPAFADTKPELDARVREAKLVLDEVMASPDQHIPEELLAKAKAIAIYPSVLKAGFILGGRFGKGVILKRDEATNKWGAVAFSTIGGGSWGLQIGASSTDLVLVVMNERGLDGILNSNFTLGADAGVAAGPVGRQSEASTDLSLKAGIYSYSRSRGLFGGIALDGAVMTEDDASNSAYYGKPVTSRDILQSSTVPVASGSAELVKSLDEYSSRWKGGK